MINEIAENIATDDIVLPSLPEVAHYIQTQFESEGFSLIEVSHLVGKDPALAARMVKAAKTPFYRSIHPVESVRDAVLRMGAKATKSIAFCQLRESAFNARQAVIKKCVNDVWQKSIDIAAISCALSRRYSVLTPDRALLGGLLHDIGSLLLLTYLDEKVTLPDTVDNLDRLFDLQSVRIGRMLIKHWDLDMELLEVVEQRHNWQRQHDAPADLVDLVLVAGCYQLFREGDVYGRESFHTLPAYKKLGLEQPTVGEALAVLAEADEEIEEMRSLMAA